MGIEIKKLAYTMIRRDTLYHRENARIAILKSGIDLSSFGELSLKDLKSEDIVYFCKASLAPRDKIKNYCIDNNIVLNKTNRKEYANVFVFNRDTINQFKQYYYYDPKINKIPQLSFKFTGDGLLIPVELVNHYDISLIEEIESLPQITANIKIDGIHSDFFLKTLGEFILDQKHKVIYDQNMINEINNQIIDFNMYLSLRATLSSRGPSSDLGVGILNNCAPESNEVPLVLLLSEYWDNIKSNKQGDFNFRAILAYFKTKYQFNDDWRLTLYKLLSNSKDISQSNKEIIDFYLSNKIQKILGGKFEIEEIKFIIK